MVFDIPSDSLLRFALYSGLAVSLLTFVLLGVITVLRLAIDREKRLEQILMDRWQPVFFHAMEGEILEFPRVRAGDWEVVLLLWINCTESIRGVARQRLQALAHQLQLDQVAGQLLKRRGRARLRLMAVVALGRMEAAEAFGELSALTEDSNPMLSLLAVRSLLQIDPHRALPILLERLAQRDDWPFTRVAAMLEEIPHDILAQPLLQALSAATPATAPRFISLLNVAHIGDTWPVLAPLLAPDQTTDILVAALKACHDPRGLETVRLLATHDGWAVRAQAAAALGRIGTAEDRLRLQAMLSDSEWWVRYRAAAALAGFPGMSQAKLADLCSRLSDRFAVDILTHAMAEKNSEAVR